MPIRLRICWPELKSKSDVAIKGVAMTVVPAEHSARREAQALVRAKDWPGAIAAYTELAAACPDDSGVLAALAQCLSRASLWPEACGIAGRVVALQPDDPTHVERWISLLLRTEQAPAAAVAGDSAMTRGLHTQHAGLALACARAFVAVGRPAEALPLLTISRALAPEHRAVWLTSLKAAGQAGDVALVATLTTAVVERFPEDAALQVLAARAATEARAAALVPARVPALPPQPLQPADRLHLRQLGQLASAQGQWAAAITHLSQAVALAPDDAVCWGGLYVAHREIGQHDAAVVAAENLARCRPQAPAVWRRLASARLRAGGLAGAKLAFQESISLRRPMLSPDVAVSLDAIQQQKTAGQVPSGWLDWAWQVAGDVDRSEAARQQFDAVAVWGALADRVLRDVAEVYPERWRDVAAMVDMQHIECLREPLMSGRGVLLALAHLGPVMAVAPALEALGLDFRWVSSGSQLAGGPVHARLISTEDLPTQAVAKAMGDVLQSGGLLATFLDSAAGQPAQASLFGHPITVNDIGARLLHQTRAAACFVAPVWRNGRIVMAIVPMPEVQAGEPLVDYTARWVTSYAQLIEASLKTRPENLKLSGGFWSAIRNTTGATADAAA
jgi:tetratricopeptide (TPR) repeat protein